jgi:multidrug efflux pump subunit AcrB
VTFPTPAGGKYRQIMVDIDSTKARGQRAPPADVVNAVNAQTLTLPSGLVKIGDMQYTLRQEPPDLPAKGSAKHVVLSALNQF